MTTSKGMLHRCEFCGHDFARDPQPTHHCDPRLVRDRAYGEGWKEASDHVSTTWRALVKSTAETTRLWAVSMGGNTALALVAKMLAEIVEPTWSGRPALVRPARRTCPSCGSESVDFVRGEVNGKRCDTCGHQWQGN